MKGIGIEAFRIRVKDAVDTKKNQEETDRIRRAVKEAAAASHDTGIMSRLFGQCGQQILQLAWDDTGLLGILTMTYEVVALAELEHERINVMTVDTVDIDMNTGPAYIAHHN